MKDELGFENIDFEELVDFITTNNESDYILIDVRQPEEYMMQHIPGAVLIPLLHLESKIFELPEDMNIIIYCRVGNRSRSASALVVESEISSKPVYNLLGGIRSWRGMLLTTVPRLTFFNGYKKRFGIIKLCMSLEKSSMLFYKYLAEKFIKYSISESFTNLANSEHLNAKTLYNYLDINVDFIQFFETLEITTIEGGEKFEYIKSLIDDIYRDENFMNDIGFINLLGIIINIKYESYDLYRSLAEKSCYDDLKKILLELSQSENKQLDFFKNCPVYRENQHKKQLIEMWYGQRFVKTKTNLIHDECVPNFILQLEDISIDQFKLPEFIKDDINISCERTGAHSYNSFLERVNEEYQRVIRYNERFTILYLTLDNLNIFTKSNRDKNLTAFGSIVRNKTRKTDLLFENERDGYIILFQNTNYNDLEIPSRRILENLKTFGMSIENQVQLSIKKIEINKDVSNPYELYSSKEYKKHETFQNDIDQNSNLYFYQRFAEEFYRAQRYKSCLCAIIIKLVDFENFSKVSQNEIHMGFRFITEIKMRKVDMVFYDESLYSYIFLLPSTNMDGSNIVRNKIVINLDIFKFRPYDDKDKLFQIKTSIIDNNETKKPEDMFEIIKKILS
ncbi:MAG: hypothetical protein GY760_14520 [Deltaproteobacteria bacterium]|nr:hypothetical protein [Deltaproteobacteria bacterium]